VGLERGPLSLMSTVEELLERNSSGSGLGPRIWPWGSFALTMQHPLSTKEFCRTHDRILLSQI
jgi:hypothetical protein